MCIRDSSNAIWHYARGVAAARTGATDMAIQERGGLAALKDSVQISFLDTSDYPASVLLGIADALVELKAVCDCGRKATMNLRVDAQGKAVREGAQTEIGGNDRYVAMCRRHFCEALAG